MPRPRKQPSLTSGQALFVVERALADRKLTASEVDRYVRSMRDEISALEQRLAALRHAVVEPVQHAVDQVRTTITKRRRRARKRALSAEREASQQLQGQYLGYLRQISERQRERFKKMARDLGREKAVAEMKKVLGK